VTSVLKQRWRAVSLVAMLLAVPVVAPDTAGAGPGQACEKRTNNTYEKLLECASADGASEHLEAFQAIADENGGTRASGTPGYEASVDYVAEQARSWGYDVTVQEFDFPTFEPLGDPTMDNITTGESYVPGEDVLAFTYSGSGDVTATAEGVDLQLPPPDEPGVTSGCEPEDFADFTAGNIALIQRGACNFSVKAINAEAAGASAVVIFNEGQPGRTDAVAGTLGDPVVDIPVLGTSFDIGSSLDGDEVHLTFEALIEIQPTWNVLAESRHGRDDNVVTAGAHLDSVLDGPGINDNGSGSAALLDVAEAMRKVRPENKVRFAWWGAEEFGLRGSDHYVSDLSDEERDDIGLYLNFDMVASPNFVRFVYDGSGDAFGLPGPDGSAAIEELYTGFYDHHGLASEPTQISFRSDYAAFFDSDIPFGGLFTGAEGIKTPEQAEVYGGVAGEQYDPCYHQACDGIDNFDSEVFDLNIDSIAFSLLTYGYSTEDVNGEPGKDVPGGPLPGFGDAAPVEGAGGSAGGGGYDHDADR
jgi:Zn-dependent M28 family amino/carboxypeptidase